MIDETVTRQKFELHVVLEVDVERAIRALKDVDADDVSSMFVSQLLTHLASLKYVTDRMDIELIPYDESSVIPELTRLYPSERERPGPREN